MNNNIIVNLTSGKVRVSDKCACQEKDDKKIEGTIKDLISISKEHLPEDSGINLSQIPLPEITEEPTDRMIPVVMNRKTKKLFVNIPTTTLEGKIINLVKEIDGINNVLKSSDKSLLSDKATLKQLAESLNRLAKTIEEK